jgi:hypothetical protein
MKNRAWFPKILLAGVAALVAAMASPAQAQKMRYANGTAYWDVDPGPIDPGAYWTSGLYKYDPNGYLERNWRDSDQVHEMTVYADHAGKQNCVFRKRVTISTWDFQHPYLRVCRKPQKD